MALDHGQGKVLSLCFCGEDRIASGGSDNLVRVWDLSTQKMTANFTGHTGSVAALACDPTGKTLVSGGFDTTIRVWQLTSSGEGQIGGQAERVIEDVQAR
jgi:WD40 repeat protein